MLSMLTLTSFLTSSFGHRYTQTQEDDDTVSNIGVVAENCSDLGSDHGSDRECVICAETKSTDEFPWSPISASCNHPPSSCLDCVEMSIKTDLNTKIWTEIRCPECSAALDYLGIQQYADEETFSR